MVNVLNDIISVCLDKYGFKKKSSSWYKMVDSLILVVNLQKSQYGYQYYLNFGIGIREFLRNDFPKEYSCDVRYRLTSVIPADKQGKCTAACDLENNLLSADDRKIILHELLDQHGLVPLMRYKSLKELASGYSVGGLPDWMITARLRELISTK